MASPPKRQRFDASALSSSDLAATPMATARKSLLTYVESLQPSIATILSRLGVEFLVCLHKLSTKTNQAKKFEDDPDLIPKSARIKFALKANKLVEQDAEYIRLAGDTASIVTQFQNALRDKILEVTKLEIAALKKVTVETYATHIKLAIQASLVCESDSDTTDVEKYIHTILHLYGDRLLAPIETTPSSFKEIYCRKHALARFPPPFLTEMPEHGDRARAANLPPQRVLQLLPKLWRTLETIFVIPWTQYLDVVDRTKKNLELKKLNENFFNSKSTDDAAMLVDAEPPADPEIMQDLIQRQVSVATKHLTDDIKKLRISMSKNLLRDQPGASLKKKSGRGNRKRAAGSNNDSAAAKTSRNNKVAQRSRSSKSSSAKQSKSRHAAKK